ncbi:MAG: amidohydrolase family protein [Planctomycetes bacterium]|nr:amidohydrolase family protein [Planctomycetota bacterium]
MELRSFIGFLLTLILAGASVGLPQDSTLSDVTDADVETDADRAPKTRTGGNALIRNATVITVGPAGTIAGGSVLVRDGKIAALGRDLEAPAGVTVIDGTGLYVMPGIIDCHSHIANEGGLNESTQVVTPEVLVRDTLRPDDLSIWRAAAGGVTAANVLHGSANAIGGQNAVIKMRYRAPSPSALLFEGAPLGVKFALGENPKQSNWGRRGNRFPNTRSGVEAAMRRAFTEAQEYRRVWAEYGTKRAAGENPLPPRRDLRLEALVGIMAGDIRVHCHCYRADEILMVMKVAEDFGFRIATLQHVLEGYKVAPEIAAHGAGASSFSDWWAYKIEAYDATPYSPALMHEAGVNVSLNSDSGELMRHLYVEAAKAVKYGGVPEIEALKMITLNPARQLGIAARAGSIEPGKDADLALFNGHPLSPYSRCVMTLIDGEVVFERPDVSNHATAGFDPAQRVRRAPMEIPRSGVYAIQEAAIFPVSGPPLPRGTLVIRDGRIESVGDGPPPQDATIINGAGLSVYPGLIDTGTSIALTEIGSVYGTRDEAEIGFIQPDLKASTALNPHSELVPVARANGLTTVVSSLEGGLICGQATLIHLAGWVPNEMLVRDPLALVVNFPPVRKPEKDPEEKPPAEEKKEKEDTRLKELREFVGAAKRFVARLDEAKKGAMKPPERDLLLEAMEPYLRGERPVMFNANAADDIRAAVQFAEEFGLKPVIAGGAQAWKVARFLAEKKVPVLVGSVFELPPDKYDPYDSPYANAARLWKAGVKFGIRTGDSSNARNLPYQAAMAAAHGLPREEALKAITLYPAQILGVADQIGSLQPGMRADVILTTGDPLEVVTDVVAVFIDGRPQSLETRHTRLYEKFRGRLQELKETGR